MLPTCVPAGARSRAPRLHPFACALLALVLLGCGVPLSADEIAATAEVQGTPEAELLGLDTQALAQGGRAAIQPVLAIATMTPDPTLTVTASPSVSTTPGTVTPTPSPAASASPTATVSPTAGTPVPYGTPSAAQSAEAVRLVNELRVAQGQKALTVNGTLTTSANAFAKLMAESNQFGHLGPDGSTPQGRVTASGYKGRFRGEALAAGHNTAKSVVDTWRDSPAHAAILLDPTAVEVGLGYFLDPGDTYAHYWVFIVGAP